MSQDSQPNDKNFEAQQAEVAARIAKATVERDRIAAEIAEEQDNIERVQAGIRELQRQITLAQAEANAKSTRIFDERRAIRLLDRDISDAQHEIERIKRNAEAEVEFAKSLAQFDFISNNAFWNDKAMKHQLEGAKVLAASGRGILADKMGLGKTFTSLIWADLVEAKKLLIITPNDVVKNFDEEVGLWAPHRDARIYMSGMTKMMRERTVSMLAKLPEFTVVINYEAWRKDYHLIEQFVDLQFDAIIIDEAHNIKDRKGIAFRGIRDLVYANNKCNFCGSNDLSGTACNLCGTTMKEFGDFCSIKNVLPMTGTPILNKPQDLFSILNLVDRRFFHSEAEYLRTYCFKNYSGRWEFQPGGLKRLTNRISSYYLARTAKDAGIEMPAPKPITYMLTCDEELYPEQYKVMQQLNEYAAIQIADDKVIGIQALIALITRKRQAVTWPAGIRVTDDEGMEVLRCDARESVKLDRVIKWTNGEFSEWEGLIPDITSGGERDVNNIKRFAGERIVVFSQFREVLSELQRRCDEAGISTVRLDGSTTNDIKDQIRVDFDRRSCDEEDYTQKWQVVLANYKTGGVGLNLTGATHTIIVDEEWNPGKEDQAIARNNRMGQTGETTLHTLLVEGTIDAWMHQLIEQKRDMIDGFSASIDLAAELRKAIQDGEF